jgi:iron complex outermembrane receptor protein
VGRCCYCFAIALLIATSAWPQEAPKDLASKSLEDLMSIDVTSVSKKEQKLSRTAAAVFVITQDDIRRSGATNIPDLLRMVPGMDVAQISANTWAISARGLNGEFSHELLVLLDGRKVYSPTTGGVFWDVLDVPLEDIERIEVIRGPGGSVWGANAVNGVVNIITRKASETRGKMIVAGGGNLDQGFGTAQQGGSFGTNIDYRVYTKYFNQYHMPGLTGQNGADGWHALHGGFRMDSTPSTKDTLAFQGDLYTGRDGVPSTYLPSITSPAAVNVNLETNLSGGFIQSVWNHVYSTRSDTSLQISFDRSKREDALGEARNTVSVDFQHHIAWGGRQDFVWGLGYLYTSSQTTGTLSITLHPADLNTQLFSSFIQDEIAIVKDRVYLTAGAKLEHNYFTGLVLMPMSRVTWTPNNRHMLWAAISHVQRTPASVDTTERINAGGFPGPGGTPVLVSIFGNPHFRNEGLVAYEMGYRTTIVKNVSIDFAAYYNDYENQKTIEPIAPFFEPAPPPPHLVLPLTYENLMYGETQGAEVAANWKVTDRWTLSPGYAFEQIHLHTSPGSMDTTSGPADEGGLPRHSAQVRSHLDLGHRTAWDTSTYFVDRLTYEKVPAYTRLDTGLSWQWSKKLSISVFGQNLLRDHHLEFIDTGGATRSTLVKRSVYAKILWQF